MIGCFKDAMRDVMRNAMINNRLHHALKAGKELQLNGTALMVLAPHPDDEVFGCAGLLARALKEGKEVHVAVMTGGGGSHRGCCATDEGIVVDKRRKLALNAAEALGLSPDRMLFLGFRDGAISENDEENMDRLKGFVRQANPANIFVPHHGEGWPDHLAARRIGISLAPEKAAVWEYCVWMWYYRQKGLDWASARVLRMDSDEHARKLAAIREYTAPCAPCGKPWSGVLPPLFVKANSTDTELFFKAR